MRRVEDILGRRINGEDPRNECSDWSKQAIVALDFFRGELRRARYSYETGHLTLADLNEIADDCDHGIDAVMCLDGSA